MKKAVRMLMAGGAAALTGGLTLAISSFYAPFFPPVRHGVPLEHPAACAHVAWDGLAFRHSGMECAARLVEARIIAANPGLAVRDGDTLHIRYRGRQALDLVPEPGVWSDNWQTCDSYILSGALPLFDPAAGRAENVARILCHQGEFDQTLVILPTGERILVPQASSSPDGHLLVTGNNAPNESYAGHATIDRSRLTILSWPDRRIVARFQAGCRVLAWRDSTHFSATCLSIIRSYIPWQWDERRPAFFLADVSREQDGQWRMQGTHWVNPTMSTLDAFGDLDFAEMASIRRLPVYIATADANLPALRSTE